jgi:hypothetical protein
MAWKRSLMTVVAAVTVMPLAAAACGRSAASSGTASPGSELVSTTRRAPKPGKTPAHDQQNPRARLTTARQPGPAAVRSPTLRWVHLAAVANGEIPYLAADVPARYDSQLVDSPAWRRVRPPDVRPRRSTLPGPPAVGQGISRCSSLLARPDGSDNHRQPDCRLPLLPKLAL